MIALNKSQMASGIVKEVTFRLPSNSTKDDGKVQLGGQGPVFRKSFIEDQGKVRIGGQGPIFRK